MANNGVYKLPEVPKQPPGYKGTAVEQRAFLNAVRPKLTNRFEMARMTNKNLKESLYYAEELGNANALGSLTKERVRRVAPPFRPPEPARPNMPHQAGIPVADLVHQLLNRIYLARTPASQIEAYHTFVNVYLTDWVDREGYRNATTGQQMIHQPFYDMPEMLIYLENAIEVFLKQCEERPNPRTLNKRPGNSYRQQLLKDLREKIQKRLVLLQEETFNKLTKNEREGRRGGRSKTLRRRRYSRRRLTKGHH
jgi:hypothetical protein